MTYSVLEIGFPFNGSEEGVYIYHQDISKNFIVIPFKFSSIEM